MDFKESLHHAVREWLVREENVDCKEVTRVWEYHDEGAGCETCGWDPYDEARVDYIDSRDKVRQWASCQESLGTVIGKILEGWP